LPNPSSNERKLTADEQLALQLAEFIDDPLGFVMFAYPWDTDKSIQIVRLVEPWASRYNCEFGPDAWACQYLDDLGAAVRDRGFDGVNPVKPIQMAVSSGHGIGKSAMAGWLTDWLMSTRPHSNGVVTANTGQQLETKTWANIAAWTAKCCTAHWFKVNTGKGSLKMFHAQHPDTWKVVGQTCREENSEAFAGLHAANSTPWYLFDEASAVPDKIWEVAEGGKTDGEPMHFVFGNPTRNTGAFSRCFGSQRHLWNTRQIDSRKVAITNKELLNGWVKEYGEDSDFVKVRVRGVFPNASSLQFIPRGLVDEAMKRELAAGPVVGRACAVGVDVARFGDDQSVIRTRIGRDARSISPKRYRGLDTMQLASRVAEHLTWLKQHWGLRPVCFVDGGGVGGGVVDRLRQLNHEVIEVQFGGKPDDSRIYLNKRAEMWGRAKEWLKIGCLEDCEELAVDLTSVEYQFTPADQIQLESKEGMKKRGLASPDDGDALCLTFAYPVPEHSAHDLEVAARHANPPSSREYDPYENI
jgi:hypothetical protein